MPFDCPGCGRPIGARPDRPLVRCRSCGALIRCRPRDTGGGVPLFEVSVAGRDETRRLVELPWDRSQRRRLSLWLACSTLATLGLVALLYLLARVLPARG